MSAKCEAATRGGFCTRKATMFVCGRSKDPEDDGKVVRWPLCTFHGRRAMRRDYSRANVDVFAIGHEEAVR